MPLEQLDELYREIILDHYKSPRNRAVPAEANVKAEGKNPLCGDEITLEVRVEDGVVRDVGLQGKGCSISLSSGSMMTEAIKGKPLAEATALLAGFKELMRGHEPGVELGDLEALGGVRKFPVRVKCALLAWTTLEQGLKGHNKVG
ncbi:MAG: SUF system NifU family Fe-S cluster assembly protein [Chloroflexi bacterium]|nr:SUF system NifU family Fe-S cluster assembly protein [Chloroflexota bacterium]